MCNDVAFCTLETVDVLTIALCRHYFDDLVCASKFSTHGTLVKVDHGWNGGYGDTLL